MIKKVSSALTFTTVEFLEHKQHFLLKDYISTAQAETT